MTVPTMNVGLATVLPGAASFKFENNVNPTYRGRVVVGDNDIRLAFIKDLDSKQLANELLAAALATGAGLPIPRPYLGFVPEGDLSLSAAPASADGSGRYVFVSVDAQTPAIWQCYDQADPTAYEDACRRLGVWSKTGLMYGFDSWIANTDRHQGNLLFEGDNVYLIDHGHAFAGPTWTVADLDPGKIFSNKLRDWLTPHIAQDQREQKLAEAMSLSSLANDNSLTEASSASNFGQFLDASEGPALVSFLKDRGQQLEPIVADALQTKVGVA